MPTSFGALLRRLRLAASLSQEALAEMAHVSTSAIGAYERGIHAAPHANTVALLADALALEGEPRGEFERLARRKPRNLNSDATSDAVALDNLPLQTTSFVGRDADLEEIEELLRRHRLVTITGTAGVGKTRVAVNVAARLKALYAGGAAFVDFGSTSDEALVLTRLASALKLPPPTSASNVDVFVGRLRELDAFLVFDNCEHLLESTGSLAAALIRAAPNVRILATSRERLRLSGEVVYRLSTLPVPPAEPASASEARSFAAIQLFVERVCDFDRTFALKDSHVVPVARICRALDGIPLALELAAARVPSLGLAGLSDQLEMRLAILSGGNRDIPTRQRTLDATLAWSYDLLEKPEQTVFRRVSAFAGGWTLEAAQLVCSDDSLTADVVCDALTSLVEKSLVVADTDSTVVRYRLLHVMGAFALEKALQADEIEANAKRHAEWVVRIAGREIAQRGDAAQQRGLLWDVRWARFETEVENIRAAIEWALRGNRDPLLAANVINAFFGFWRISGFLEEHRRWARAALELIDEDSHPRVVATLLFGLANTAIGTERVAAGERAVALFEAIGDSIWLARALGSLAWALHLSGQLDRTASALDRADSLFRANGLTDTIFFAEVVMMRGTLSIEQGDFELARARYEEALAIGSLRNVEVFVIACQVNLGELEFMTGDYRAAIQRADDALVRTRKSGARNYEMVLLSNRAGYRLACDDLDGARTDALAALRLARNDNLHAVTLSVRLLATIAALQGNAAPAARLIGFILESNARRGVALDPTERVGHDVLLASLRSQLSEQAIVSLQREGARLEIDDAIGEALAAVDAS